MDAQGCAALAEFPISSLAAQACPLPNRMTFATGTGLLFCVNAAGLFSSHSNRPPVGGPVSLSRQIVSRLSRQCRGHQDSRQERQECQRRWRRRRVHHRHHLITCAHLRYKKARRASPAGCASGGRIVESAGPCGPSSRKRISCRISSRMRSGLSAVLRHR